MLVFFMTVEAGHSHDLSRRQQHANCIWCSIAHVTAVVAAILLLASSNFAGEQISPKEGGGKSCLAIFVGRIRPPPYLQPKDSNA